MISLVEAGVLVMRYLTRNMLEKLGKFGPAPICEL